MEPSTLLNACLTMIGVIFMLVMTRQFFIDKQEEQSSGGAGGGSGGEAGGGSDDSSGDSGGHGSHYSGEDEDEEDEDDDGWDTEPEEFPTYYNRDNDPHLPPSSEELKKAKEIRKQKQTTLEQLQAEQDKEQARLDELNKLLRETKV